jgi:hypothetical protein
MADKKRSKGQSGGVNVSSGSVTVGGDIVGRDKITASSSEVSSGDLVELVKQFAQIKETIDQRADDPDIDKTELRGLVESIEQEVKKGEAANPSKVERWLRFLAETADDIFQVTVATLTHPVVGVAKVIQLVAQKAKEKAT